CPGALRDGRRSTFPVAKWCRLSCCQRGFRARHALPPVRQRKAPAASGSVSLPGRPGVLSVFGLPSRHSPFDLNAWLLLQFAVAVLRCHRGISCPRWLLVDPHALRTPVKRAKSRRIVANETAADTHSPRLLRFKLFHSQTRIGG